MIAPTPSIHIPSLSPIEILVFDTKTVIQLTGTIGETKLKSL